MMHNTRALLLHMTAHCHNKIKKKKIALKPSLASIAILQLLKFSKNYLTLFYYKKKYKI